MIFFHGLAIKQAYFRHQRQDALFLQLIQYTEKVSSGAGVRKDVGVQVLPSEPSERAEIFWFQPFFYTFYSVQFGDVIREKPVPATAVYTFVYCFGIKTESAPAPL